MALKSVEDVLWWVVTQLQTIDKNSDHDSECSCSLCQDYRGVVEDINKLRDQLGEKDD